MGCRARPCSPHQSRVNRIQREYRGESARCGAVPRRRKEATRSVAGLHRSARYRGRRLRSQQLSRPPLPTRLMAGLAILKHMHNLSDEVLWERWLENPYYQRLYGEDFFCHQLPSDRSSMTRWRQRMGENSSSSRLSAGSGTATTPIPTNDPEVRSGRHALSWRPGPRRLHLRHNAPGRQA
jgi:hypothetical protein